MRFTTLSEKDLKQYYEDKCGKLKPHMMNPCVSVKSKDVWVDVVELVKTVHLALERMGHETMQWLQQLDPNTTASPFNVTAATVPGASVKDTTAVNITVLETADPANATADVATEANGNDTTAVNMAILETADPANDTADAATEASANDTTATVVDVTSLDTADPANYTADAAIEGSANNTTVVDVLGL